MKVVVHVSPKPSVLDPQGAAVEHALHSLGMVAATRVRVGKTVVFDLPGVADGPELRARLDTLCRDLFSNPVIEDWSYTVEPS